MKLKKKSSENKKKESILKIKENKVSLQKQLKNLKCVAHIWTVLIIYSSVKKNKLSALDFIVSVLKKSILWIWEKRNSNHLHFFFMMIFN